jgi:hypothetical protein
MAERKTEGLLPKFLWTQRSGFGPAPRGSHSMAYDSNRGRVVLFGGISADGRFFGDTWEWDGSRRRLILADLRISWGSTVLLRVRGRSNNWDGVRRRLR